MKSLAFGFGFIALGLTIATPAFADYAVVRFGDGYCQIWSDASDTPWGVNWTKIAIAADWTAARAALDSAIANQTCND